MASNSTNVSPSSNGKPAAAPDPEVRPGKAKRRTFSAQQKLKILNETDNLPEGELGAYLRRKGIYSSALSRWRKERERGVFAALQPRTRGTSPASAEAKRVAELEREVSKLRQQLDRAEKVIQVQKKLCELFTPTVEEDERK